MDEVQAISTMELDQEWLSENYDKVVQTSRDGFEVSGRGVVVVDLSDEPPTIIYVPAASVPQDTDTTTMVHDYSPPDEFVLVLIRPGDIESSYRIACHTPKPWVN